MALDSPQTTTKNNSNEGPSLKGKRSKRSRAATSAPSSEEEQLALCLMLLSRDGSSLPVSKPTIESAIKQASFDCSICGRSFPSYQALGGHKTSHRKPPAQSDDVAEQGEKVKVHECSICLRTFPSGQALGGHKRLHYEGGAGGPKVKFDFDLNLPAQEEEELEEQKQEEQEWVEDEDGERFRDFLGVKKARRLLC